MDNFYLDNSRRLVVKMSVNINFNTYSYSKYILIMSYNHLFSNICIHVYLLDTKYRRTCPSRSPSTAGSEERRFCAVTISAIDSTHTLGREEGLDSRRRGLYYHCSSTRREQSLGAQVKYSIVSITN